MAISPVYAVPFVEAKPNQAFFEAQKEREKADALARLDISKKGCWRLECDKQGLDSHGQKLLKCGGCKVASYCSKGCQVGDWKKGGHKDVCKSLSAKEA